MSTTVEFPDELLSAAKRCAALEGISLRQFLIEAVQQKITPSQKKVRRDPPIIGDPDPNANRIGLLTPEQIDEAMFG